MSAINGDKSRFHRDRKQKIAAQEKDTRIVKKHEQAAESLGRFGARAGIEMTTPLLAVPTGSSVARPVKKKRVLLIDPSPSKCELRATALRKLGIDVDCT